MFGLVVAFVAILCLNQVSADNHGCVSDNDAKAINETVEKLAEMFSPTLIDQSLTDEAKATKILGEICNSQMANGANNMTKTIERLIASCPALITRTSLPMLTFLDLTFVDMFERFASVDNFCDCTAPLMQTLSLVPAQSALYDNPTGVKYPFIKVSVLCSADAAKVALTGVNAKLSTCPNLYKYAPDLLTATNIPLMVKFATDGCVGLNNTKFTCAVDYSKTQTFKDCIMDADKTTGDMDTMCKRTECVKKSTCDDEGLNLYMVAVNMRKGTEKTFSADVCDGVSSVVASVGVLVIALSALFLF